MQIKKKTLIYFCGRIEKKKKKQSLSLVIVYLKKYYFSLEYLQQYYYNYKILTEIFDKNVKNHRHPSRLQPYALNSRFYNVYRYFFSLFLFFHNTMYNKMFFFSLRYKTEEQERRIILAAHDYNVVEGERRSSGAVFLYSFHFLFSSYNATSAGAVLKLALRLGLRRKVPSTFIISLTTGGGSCFLTGVCF